MKIAPNLQFRNWFILGLLVQLVAAWFSIGYHQPDEHFQVLEFANHKLGLSPGCDLAWEYAARCRSALQPSVVYALGRGLQMAGWYNPFTVAFLLRLIMGLLTWWTTTRILRRLFPELITQRGKQALVWCGFFLWFVPYVGVRFSAENISGLFFFLSFTFLYPFHDLAAKNPLARLLLAGLLLGFSVFIRLQLCIAVLGLVCWLLRYGKWPIRLWLIIGAGGIIAIALSVCLDRWFYGDWTFSPWNYFSVNMIHHKASAFGVDPWWYYFSKYLDIGVPPISVVLLPLFFIGVWQKRHHVLSWIVIAFIAAHCLIAHKEIRFLFPVSLAFIFLACSGFDYLVQLYPGRKYYRWAIPLFAALNSIMLVVKIFTPAHEAIKYYEAIYNYAGKQKPVLVSYETPVYQLVGLCVNFYQPKNLEEHTISNPGELTRILKTANGRPVLFLNHQLTPDPMLQNFRLEKVYCILPSWMAPFNFTNWQSRSYIWTVYRIYEK